MGDRFGNGYRMINPVVVGCGAHNNLIPLYAAASSGGETSQPNCGDQYDTRPGCRSSQIRQSRLALRELAFVCSLDDEPWIAVISVCAGSGLVAIADIELAEKVGSDVAGGRETIVRTSEF